MFVFDSLTEEVHEKTNPRPLCDLMITQLIALDGKWSQMTESFRLLSYPAYNTVDKYVRNHLTRKTESINAKVRINVIEESQLSEQQDSSQNIRS